MLYYAVPEGHTVTATIHTAQLYNLAKAIRGKRPRRLSVHLLHDNARPDVAEDTLQKIKELGWDTVPHQPYSPVLALPTHSDPLKLS